MTDNSETVREVLLSVEKHAKTCRDDFERGVFNQQTQVMGTIFNDFFIRLTLAHDREVSAYEREMAAKDEEIARLKTAMKPVMECKILKRDEDRYLVPEHIFDAVREAQRIMKEGGVK